MKPLTIVLITHNRLDYTKRTIESLARTVPFASLIVYDNASDEPGMKEYLREGEWRSKFLTNLVSLMPDNIGWAAAVNKVIHLANDEMVLISNNDCEYKDGWYETCLALFKKYPKLGICGVWKHINHGVDVDHGDMEERGDMPAVGWLIPRTVLEDVGDLEERGPCATKGGNGEDSDYVRRVREKGYLVGAPKEDVGEHITGY